MHNAEPYATRCSISSRVRPFVSGTQRWTKTKPTKQMAAYSQKVPDAPSARLSTGKVKVSTKQAIHSAETAIETATPRTRLGKISEISTQVTGASDMA